ncbi:MAG: DJ-1/PfpI family protein [Lentisphaerae bacterium]|nr:DJ-1/PfpI family protein [Lentisphaerota bacterium]
MEKKIAVILADGFEEIEAVIPIDVFRRLEFEVVVAGLSKTVKGSHGIKIQADCLLSDLKEPEIDAVFLPGGMPGATNLRDSSEVLALVRKVNAKGGIVSAICAAPIVLKAAGVIEGKTVTSHPSVKNELKGCSHTGNLTETDGNIITGKGPGAAFEFAVKVASALGKTSESESLMKNMFVQIK